MRRFAVVVVWGAAAGLALGQDQNVPSEQNQQQVRREKIDLEFRAGIRAVFKNIDSISLYQSPFGGSAVVTTRDVPNPVTLGSLTLGVKMRLGEKWRLGGGPNFNIPFGSSVGTAGSGSLLVKADGAVKFGGYGEAERTLGQAETSALILGVDVFGFNLDLQGFGRSFQPVSRHTLYMPYAGYKHLFSGGPFGIQLMAGPIFERTAIATGLVNMTLHKPVFLVSGGLIFNFAVF